MRTISEIEEISRRIFREMAMHSKMSDMPDSGGSNRDHDPRYLLRHGIEKVFGEKDFQDFPLTPSADPDADYEVANKQYVDGHSPQITVSDVAPTSPSEDDLWVDTSRSTRGEPHLITPDSITKISGGAETGTVSDIQTAADGNVYNVRETTTPNNFVIDVAFSGISRIDEIYIIGNYAGTTAHNVIIGLYDSNTSSYDAIGHFPNSDHLHPYLYVVDNYRGDYVTSPIVRFNHITNGNASHFIYLDYVAIRGRP